MELGTQERFWHGDFGDHYIERNRDEKLLASNVSLFATVLAKKRPIASVLEIGANVGLNLTALSRLFPSQRRVGIEINQAAHQLLEENPDVNEAVLGPIVGCELSETFDLVLSKGVLIHLDPDSLSRVYQAMADWSQKYVLIMEYYNPTPITIPYRGHSEKLFKRDFAGEFLDQNKEFQLVDYGFSYHRDSNHPQDDITWFLLERSVD